MTVTKVGLVYYADDPTQAIFRIILPSLNDSEITDEVCPCGCGDLHWIGHLNKARKPTLKIVDADSAEAHAPRTGTP